VILNRIWGDETLRSKSWAIQLNPDPVDEGLWRSRDVMIMEVRLEEYVAAFRDVLTSRLSSSPTGSVDWHITLEAPSADLAVGDELTLTLRFRGVASPGSVPVEVPASALELAVYVEAPGFYLEGEHLRTIAVMGGRLKTPNIPLRLQAASSGEHQLTVAVHVGDRTGGPPAVLSRPARVLAPVTVPSPPELVDAAAIPEPRPDVVLHVLLEQPLEESPDHDGEQVRLYLTCDALEKDRELLPPLQLTSADLVGLREAAIEAGAGSCEVPPADNLAALQAYGTALFRMLMPPGHPLRRRYWQIRALARGRLWSWLIISDERTLLPWELLCPYRLERDAPALYDEFLADRFMVAHWVAGHGLALANEAPIGRVGLTHYQQHPGRTGHWRAALGNGEVLEDQDGHLPPASVDNPYHGLHVLRFGEQRPLGRVTEWEGDDDGGRERRDATGVVGDRRLDLALQRPVVGLSFLREHPLLHAPEHGMWDTRLEPGWTLPMLHAGASAVVGPRWPVQPESDQLFVRAFHEALWDGAAVGLAVWEARQRVRRTHPDRSDWLAYAHFGHPSCAPYLVRPAKGFTLLEAIDQPEDELFRPGRSYSFRASYRADTPAWYGGRLRVPEAPLADEDVSVLVMPLTGEHPTTYRLEQMAPGSPYQRVFELTMPADEETLPLLVRFQKDEQELRTMVVTLDIGGAGV
jgi:hypothetical protein